MEKITLKNDFHNTEVNVVPQSGELSPRQVKRAWNTLCGIDGCTCGNDLGMRGDNPEIIVDQDSDGSIYAIVN